MNMLEENLESQARSVRQSLVYKVETFNNISYGFSANVAHVLFTKCPWTRSVRIINAAFTIRADR